MTKLQNLFNRISNNKDLISKFKSLKDFDEFRILCRGIDRNLTDEDIEDTIKYFKFKSMGEKSKTMELNDNELEMVAGGKIDFNLFKTTALASLVISGGLLSTNLVNSKAYAATTTQSVGNNIGIREQKSLDNNLHKALSEWNLEKCEEFLRLGADVNSRGKDGKTPLVISVESENMDFVKLFLENGADPNINYSYTAKVLQAHSESFVALDICKTAEMANILIKAGANVNLKYTDRTTSLTKHIFAGNLEIAKTLIENGANVNDVDGNGNTLLMNATGLVLNPWVKKYEQTKIEASIDSIKFLVKNGADINAVNKNGTTPLMFAILNERHDVAKLLIENGANVNAKDKDGKTALMEALRVEDVELAKIILDKGADINAVDSEGKTALNALFDLRNDFGKCNNDSYVEKVLNGIKFLADNKADLNIKDKSGDTVLANFLKYCNHILTHPSEISMPKNYAYTMIKALINNGADVNLKDNTGSSPLIWAVKSVLPTDILKLMIEKGADINLADNEGNTALHEVTRGDFNDKVMSEFFSQTARDYKLKETGQKWIDVMIDQLPVVRSRLGPMPKIKSTQPTSYYMLKNSKTISILQGFDNLKISNNNFKLLVDSGAKIDVKDNKGQTPLMLATSNRRLEVLKHLIEKGADINAKDNEGVTTLMRAVVASGSNYDMTRVILENDKTEINLQDNKGRTALMHLFAKGYLGDGAKCTRMLFEKNANPYLKDNNGDNSFNYLLTKNTTENECLADLFIKYASKPKTADIKDANGATLLINSFKHVVVSDKIRNFLIDKTHDINAVDSDGYNTLMYAVRDYMGRNPKKVMGYVKSLIEKGISVDNKSKDGNTALMLAVKANDLDCADILINNGANINAKNTEGKTALMQTGNKKTVEFLLKNKADINSKDNSGMTALDYATKNRNFEVVKVLMKNKAAFDVHNKFYKDFFLVCVKNNETEIIRMLLGSGANVNEKDEKGDTALCVACNQAVSNYQFIYSIRLLLDNGADINVKNINGETPLMISTQYEDSDIMKFFINKGANVNEKDSNGQTAIMKAVKNTNIYTVAMSSILIENGADLKIKDNSGKTVFDYLPNSGVTAKNINHYFETVKRKMA